jgi:hypothetical protein
MTSWAAVLFAVRPGFQNVITLKGAIPDTRKLRQSLPLITA